MNASARTEAATAPAETSRIARIVEGILTRESREDLVAARAAEALAARQAEAREKIAALAPKRVAVVKAWVAQLATVQIAVKQLVAANAALHELAEADSDLYDQQDRIRFSASVPDALAPRALGALQIDHLPRALAEVNDQARRHLEVPR